MQSTATLVLPLRAVRKLRQRIVMRPMRQRRFVLCPHFFALRPNDAVGAPREREEQQIEQRHAAEHGAPASGRSRKQWCAK